MMSLSTLSSAPRWSMLGKPRTPSVDRRPIVPDPGSYSSLDPCMTSKMTRSPRAQFGSNTSIRKVLEAEPKESNPGPGAYNHQARDDLGQVPRATSAMIGTPRQRDRTSRETTPDPGNYMPASPQSTSKMTRTPSYGFSSSRASRFPTLKERAPGPGAYTHKDAIGKADSKDAGASFASSPRLRDRTRPESPDPGSYVATEPSMTSRMRRSPKANFDSRASTGRLIEKTPDSPRREAMPGPGTYSHKELLGSEGTAPSFERSAQRKTQIRTGTPDPGVYVPVDPSVTSKMSRVVGYGFSDVATGRVPLENGSKLDLAKDDEAVPNTLRSPRGSNGGHQASRKDIPGPGSYETVGPQPATAPSSPRWGFGNVEARPSQGPSRAASNTVTPGPGYYVKGPTVGVGPKFTIRGRTEGRRESTPGPGAYGGHYTQFV